MKKRHCLLFVISCVFIFSIIGYFKSFRACGFSYQYCVDACRKAKNIEYCSILETEAERKQCKKEMPIQLKECLDDCKKDWGSY